MLNQGPRCRVRRLVAVQGGEARDLILHKSSVAYLRADPVLPGSLVTYHQKMATSRSFVMDATLVLPNAVCIELVLVVLLVCIELVLVLLHVCIEMVLEVQLLSLRSQQQQM